MALVANRACISDFARWPLATSGLRRLFFGSQPHLGMEEPFDPTKFDSDLIVNFDDEKLHSPSG
jgi:hypothetical protein